jgi:chromosomal replication initiation ATPase DnaA
MKDSLRQLTLPLVWGRSQRPSDFIVNESNRYAFEWLTRWPSGVGGNFVCLVGEVGAGKTYLSNIWATRMNASVIRSAADVFDAWYDISSPSLEQRYFVLEDIDKINNELLLFYIYNTILEKESYLLMTTRTHPMRWDISLPDLKSRIATMNFVSIKKPSDETIIEIMSDLLLRRGLRIPLDCSEYLVKRIERSYEAITHWVERIDSALGNKRKITMPRIRELVNEES